MFQNKGCSNIQGVPEVKGVSKIKGCTRVQRVQKSSEPLKKS